MSDQGTKLRFSQNESHYVAFLDDGRLSRVEKATFARPPEPPKTEISSSNPVIEDIMNDE